jgi:hypothetical protein
MSQLGQKRYELSNKLCVEIEILRLDSCKAFSFLPNDISRIGLRELIQYNIIGPYNYPKTPKIPQSYPKTPKNNEIKD